MIRTFRFIGLFEGVTTLLLFFVAMPAKYAFNNPSLVPPLGALHGFAFLLYLGAMVVCLSGRGFSVWEWVRTTVASFVPFGTFLNDPLLKRKQLATAAA